MAEVPVPTIDPIANHTVMRKMRELYKAFLQFVESVKEVVDPLYTKDEIDAIMDSKTDATDVANIINNAYMYYNYNEATRHYSGYVTNQLTNRPLVLEVRFPELDHSYWRTIIFKRTSILDGIYITPTIHNRSKSLIYYEIDFRKLFQDDTQNCTKVEYNTETGSIFRTSVLLPITLFELKYDVI